MADVCDRNNQAVSARVWFGIDRIVEVSRILAVDGHERKISEIFARLRLAWIHLLSPRLRLAQRCGREHVGEIESSNRRLGRELNGTVGIEALVDLRLRRGGGAGVPSDPGNDPISGA